jgi:type II secretory pathway pseudopilin PulG
MANTNRKGIIWLEVMAALGLIGIISVLAGEAVMSYQQVQRELRLRDQLSAAAALQLQRYRAGAEPDSLPPGDLLDDAIELSTTTQPGEGDWEGMQQVTVEASGTTVTGTRLSAAMVGYFPVGAGL